jgi:four helix bundle protein
LAGQLARSGTSAGANYAEARAAESRRDFIHKLKLVLKELRESLFWLRLSKRLKLGEENLLNGAMDECNELIGIFVRSIATSRKSQKNNEILNKE